MFMATDIQAQLERILTHPKFVVADQISRFLRFVVEATIAGRQDHIKQYTIAVEALGRSSDFDPQVDALVRIQAGQLRRALRRYYEVDGRDDPIRIEIPKGRYIPAFLPNLDLAQLSHAYAAPAVFASQPQELLPAVADGPALSVLPFEFLGENKEDNYFATGLTEEIIIALTRFPDFLVIGPLNRNAIHDLPEGFQHVAQQYKVRFVLDGTVRKRGQTLRLTAKLTDVINGQYLWGDAFEYNLETTSIMEVEQEIVEQVVATIADDYGVIPRALDQDRLAGRTESLADYEAILRFHHHFRVLSKILQVEAMTALASLVQRQPSHAQATALLGDLIATTYHLGYEDSVSVLEQAEKLGRKALVLDPNCQAAHCVMALVYFLNAQRELCLEEIARVLQLNANRALYISSAAYMLAMLGERDRALELMRKAMRMNPHHPGWYYLVPFWHAYSQGDYEAALFEANCFNTPDFFLDPLIRAASLGQLSHYSEARKAVDELLILKPDFERQGRRWILRVVFMEEHLDMLAVGLRKAGLELSES